MKRFHLSLGLSLGTRFVLSTFGVLLLAPAEPAAAQVSSCPVTLPTTSPLEPPDGFGPPNGQAFFHGTPELWTKLWTGPWRGLPLWDIGYRQKIVWYSNSFARTRDTWKLPPHPETEITGRRLDGNSAPLIADGGNATFIEEGAAIMSAVNLPTLGCWEITGRMGDATTTFVVEVAP